MGRAEGGKEGNVKRDDIQDEVDLPDVERLARIVGESSAAAKALKFADEHGGRHHATFYRTYGGMLLVFPNLLRAAEEIGSA